MPKTHIGKGSGIVSEKSFERDEAHKCRLFIAH
jgi:hypothetical protein